MKKDIEQSYQRLPNFKAERKLISYESPFFSIFPNQYFRFRNFLLTPFNLKLTKDGLTLGFVLFQLSLLSFIAYFFYYAYYQDVWDVAVLQGQVTSYILGLTAFFSIKNSLVIFLTGMHPET